MDQILENQADDERIFASLERCTNVYAKIANEKFGCKILLPVKVDFNLCKDKRHFKSAGVAHGTTKISYNHVYVRKHVKEFLKWICAHEVAHLGVVSKFNAAGFDAHAHGAEWCQLMRLFGMDPHSQKKHSFDVNEAKAFHSAHKKAEKAKEKALAKLLKKNG